MQFIDLLQTLDMLRRHELVSVGVVVAGLLWIVAGRATRFRPEMQAALAARLRGLPRAGGGSASWPAAFGGFFDSVMGARTFGVTRLARSLLASALLFGLLLFVDMGPAGIERMVDRADRLPSLAIAFVCLNAVPDYVSLTETRWLLRRLEGTRAPLARLWFLALDLLVTVLIFLLIGCLGWGIVRHTIDHGDPQGFDGASLLTRMASDLWERGLTLDGPQPSIGVYFYTTLFTSVWLWAVALTWGVLRLALLLGGVARVIDRLYAWEENPLLFVGRATAVLVLLVSVLGAWAWG